MGVIKEKVMQLAERVQDLLDSGVQHNELDFYMDEWCTDDEYELYHSYKNTIFKILGEDIIQEGLTISCISDNDYIMKSLNEGRYNRSDAHPLDDLKANFRSWENDECTEEDAEELFSILRSRHPEFNDKYIKELAYNWCGLKYNDLT